MKPFSQGRRLAWLLTMPTLWTGRADAQGVRWLALELTSRPAPEAIA